MTQFSSTVDFDVIIVGAGISGINFAYRLQERQPTFSYCILEARNEIGGTWSLFKYPGIRSDSDLFTFGFPWRPWAESQSIAAGDRILNYLKESAAQEAIDTRIRFSHHVNSMDWSTDLRTWNLHVTASGVPGTTMRSRFVFLCTGYYDHHEPLQVEIPGVMNFKGPVIHPQFWPSDVDCSGKNIVVIGSGATAVTLLPSLAQSAKHVTMLQRSPSYIVSVMQHSLFESVIRRILPSRLAHRINRFRWTVLSFMLVFLSRRFPRLARKYFLHETARQLPPNTSLDPDFFPSYDPWQQRMCLCPDGDFYKALRTGKGSIKTGKIDQVTENSIRLCSGDQLNPDIIVTATGLKLSTAGGIDITIDGELLDVSQKFAWNSTMLQDLPNVFLVWGYVDASWTLGADATAQLAVRLLSQMSLRGVSVIIPRLTPRQMTELEERSFLALTSTYVGRGKNALPKVGNKGPWKPRSYYWKDLANAWWGNLDDGIQWLE